MAGRASAVGDSALHSAQGTFERLGIEFRRHVSEAVVKRLRIAFVGQRRAAHDAKAGDDQAESAQRSEEHTSELQSLMRISYSVFCLKKKNRKYQTNINK